MGLLKPNIALKQDFLLPSTLQFVELLHRIESVTSLIHDTTMNEENITIRMSSGELTVSSSEFSQILSELKKKNFRTSFNFKKSQS